MEAHVNLSMFMFCRLGIPMVIPQPNDSPIKSQPLFPAGEEGLGGLQTATGGQLAYEKTVAFIVTYLYQFWIYIPGPSKRCQMDGKGYH